MISAISIILFFLLLVAAFQLYMRKPVFGKSATGARLDRMQKSPHFKNGIFHNLSRTPTLTEGVSFFKAIKDFFFHRSEQRLPPSPLPSIKTDLRKLDPKSDVVVWFGHSSYFLQLDGKKILVDPVFSGHASPLPFTTKSFKGSDIYSVADVPAIDYLLITHDHYDHLDYLTVSELKPKVGKVITAIGVGAHLERWGFDGAIITEMDWNEEFRGEDEFSLHGVPARHFSGRTFRRNQTLWLSFILSGSRKIFIGGDSGYDTHFAELGNRFGPFDLAILENGQYNEDWRYIHTMPEEVVQAGFDLRAKQILPVHWGKFALGLHAWDEPIGRIVKESSKRKMHLIHPMIGEPINLDEQQSFSEWWNAVK